MVASSLRFGASGACEATFRRNERDPASFYPTKEEAMDQVALTCWRSWAAATILAQCAGRRASNPARYTSTQCMPGSNGGGASTQYRHRLSVISAACQRHTPQMVDARPTRAAHRQLRRISSRSIGNAQRIWLRSIASEIVRAGILRGGALAQQRHEKLGAALRMPGAHVPATRDSLSESIVIPVTWAAPACEELSRRG